MATFTEFCCRSGGSNLNAGTRTGSSTVPGTAADLTYASGSWVASTGVFTVASGNPVSDGVAVGDFASVYAVGSTVTGFVGRVTARDSTTVTVSLSAKMGTAPTDGSSNRTLKIGGAWAGPSGTDQFPLNLVGLALMNAAGNFCRVNLKNDQTYSMTSGITTASENRVVVQGFAAAYGDLGKSTVSGGSSGAAFTLLTVRINHSWWIDLIFSGNGGSSAATMVANSAGTNQVGFDRCVFVGSRGAGLNHASGTGHIVHECEATGNNVNNGGTLGGFENLGGSVTYVRCVSHHNSASNGAGFYQDSGSGSGSYVGCVAWANGQDGFIFNGGTGGVFGNCDAYANGRHGFVLSSNDPFLVENCNSLKNGGYGVNSAAALTNSVRMFNCGFGSGTQANTSGATTGTASIEETATVTYASGVTPWNAPDTGDFRAALAAAKNTGRGTFTQTQGGYTGTVGYPDIGAAQHLDAADYPAVTNVRSGTSYNSGTLTGTMTEPAVTNVKAGVTYGAGGTEFTGTYAIDYPTVGNVRSGITYASGTLTGTLTLPAAAQVYAGVGFGAGGTEFVGTLGAGASGGSPATNPTVSLCDTLAGIVSNAWTPVAPDAVARAYQFRLVSHEMTGRKVYVMPSDYDYAPGDRGEDRVGHRVTVVIVERYTDTAGLPPDSWTDARVDFVYGTILRGLWYGHSGPLLFAGRSVVTRQADVQVLDLPRFTETPAVFFAAVEFEFEELVSAP